MMQTVELRAAPAGPVLAVLTIGSTTSRPDGSMTLRVADRSVVGLASGRATWAAGASFAGRLEPALDVREGHPL